MTMALTGKTAPYKTGFGPLMGDVWRIPFPAASQGVSVEETRKELDRLFKTDIAPSRVAAIIVEPVQGEGGFNPVPPELMRVLRKVADEHGIVLIVDEIQTGFGRTGKLFAIQNYDVKPDLMTMAKGLAGGSSSNVLKLAIEQIGQKTPDEYCLISSGYYSLYLFMGNPVCRRTF